MKIDDATFVRAFGAQPRSGLELEKWEKLRFAVVTYLAELPEPEPARDRIAVVVGSKGVMACIGVDKDEEDDIGIWRYLERKAKLGTDDGPFARAIVRCTLPRPCAPIEVDGTVEEVGGGMKIDEAAFALATWNYNDHAREIARRFLDKYLAALPAEPEIEGKQRVRALCGVLSDERFEIVGWNNFDQYDESEEKSRIVGERGDAQWSWIEADVTPWQPPAEETVQGREVAHGR